MKRILPLLLLLCCMRANAQLDTISNISDTEKLYGLSVFWKEAAYNFAYFDKSNINWDSTYQAFIPRVLATKNTWDYYREMQRFCALLKDGHTNVFMPNGKLMKVGTYYPLVFSWIDGKVIVINVPKKDSLLVPQGAEVIAVNNTPILEYLQKEIIPYISASAPHQLWNDAGSQLFLHADTTRDYRLKLKTPAGKIIDHTTHVRGYRQNWAYSAPNFPWQRTRFQQLPGGIAYVQLNTFGDDSVVADFKKHLPELYQAKGVIIDLRNNGGGSTGTGIAILNYFTDKKVIMGSAMRTREHIAAYKAWGSYITDQELEKRLKENPAGSEWSIKAYNISRGKYWSGSDSTAFNNMGTEQKITVPLMILMGNNTASAAEDFLIALDDLKGRATTIGERSYGSTGQPLSFELPGGGSARICTKRDTYPDGREFVGYGVKPDIEVKRTVEDYIKKRDAQMDKAIEVVKSKI
jgi:carboxyl-terminal processing protease